LRPSSRPSARPKRASEGDDSAGLALGSWGRPILGQERGPFVFPEFGDKVELREAILDRFEKRAMRSGHAPHQRRSPRAISDLKRWLGDSLSEPENVEAHGPGAGGAYPSSIPNQRGEWAGVAEG
jgi:hypothetical protein